jgi:predicted outer membrane repeat protein
MKRIGNLLIVLLLQLVLSSSVFGREWIVTEDGTGDFTKVSEACAAATTGDTITIMPGSYSEPGVYIPLEGDQILVRGAGVVDEDVSLQLRITLRYCEDAYIENVLFHDNPGGALYIMGGSSTIRDCMFENNGGHPQLTQGMAIKGWDHPVVLVEDCAFLGNIADGVNDGTGGAIYLGGCTVRRCRFIANIASHQGGAIYIKDYSVIEDCIFIGNSAPHGAAATLWYQCTLTRCTFVDNVVTGGFGAAVEIFEDYTYPDHCLFVGTQNGAALECPGLSEITCSCFWQNDRGAGDPWYCIATSDTNIWEDPLFCDPVTGDVGLLEGSPCLPDNSPEQCGQIGAKGLGCDASPTEELSFGRIKILFR